MTDDLTILGRDVRQPSHRLECFEAPERVTWVTFASDGRRRIGTPLAAH